MEFGEPAFPHLAMPCKIESDIDFAVFRNPIVSFVIGPLGASYSVNLWRAVTWTVFVMVREVIVLQFTSISRVFAFKCPIKSQVESDKSPVKSWVFLNQNWDSKKSSSQITSHQLESTPLVTNAIKWHQSNNQTHLLHFYKLQFWIYCKNVNKMLDEQRYLCWTSFLDWVLRSMLYLNRHKLQTWLDLYTNT